MKGASAEEADPVVQEAAGGLESSHSHEVANPLMSTVAEDQVEQLPFAEQTTLSKLI